MTSNFTTSVNIIRDSKKDFQYISTTNAVQVVNQLVNDYKKGIRAFNIIGNYGTGKSSFLLALEQSLNGKKLFFTANFVDNSNVRFIKIIGAYESIIENFANFLKIKNAPNKIETIFSELLNVYDLDNNKKDVLFIIIDEFGKFLEYASKNNPETELYFIQQLAEFCNNPNYNIVFITTIHQSFESYSYALTPVQKQEWIKIKGRFRELTFNEPVEQLLILASKQIPKSYQKPTAKIAEVEKLFDLVAKTKAFNFTNNFIGEIAFDLYPLDILSAAVLTQALQKYGQNERSLFSFLESTDHTSIFNFDNQKESFYNLSHIFDYLNFNFYSFLTSKYNPDFASWASIRAALDEVERTFDDSINSFSKIVKTIGLLNIFAAAGSILNRDFLESYLKLACQVDNVKPLIDRLEQKKIILFRKHSQRFILFEGTDLDIQSAIDEAGNRLTEVTDVTALLNKHFQFSPVCAKSYSYTQGTPRFFEFVVSEEPISQVPEGEIDGVINLVFNNKIELSEIKRISAKQEEAIVYGYFKNSDEIKNLLFEIEKIRRVISENESDKVAKRELENIIIHQKNLLKHYIFDNLYKTNNVSWYWNGECKEILSQKDFNTLLSQICYAVYSKTPVFKNELVNKHKISSSIHTAKRNYFKALVNSWDQKDLGFHHDKFPPEKTIYITLLKETGILVHRENNLALSTGEIQSSFNHLWSLSEGFIESAKSEKKNLGDFVELLSKRPFKLKQGLIDFWLPTFLFLKRDDFALFGRSGYIPYLSTDNLELIVKDPRDFSIKTFNVDGVRLDIFNNYRVFLNQSLENKLDNQSFIETIKPFLIFYKQLPEYSKNTKRLLNESIKVRQVISTSTDPEETFFEGFPSALGFSLQTLQEDKSRLQQYTDTLQSAIKELRTCYDDLLQRFEDFICNEVLYDQFDFPEYRQKLQRRYKKLKKHLLLANQKVFVQRLDSQIEDRKIWLNSIAQAVTGKSMETFADDDEIFLYSKFKSIILDLDNLTKISKVDIDDKKEEVVSVKIDSFFKSIDPQIVRIPKIKSDQIDQVKEQLKKELTKDKTINIAALVNLLKDLLQ